MATATPDARSFLFDLATLGRVYDVAGTGRVPLGLLNTVYIDKANARRTGFYAGEDLPSDEYLSLSTIASAARDAMAAIDGYSHVSYEWWFIVGDDLEATSYEFRTDRAPSFRIALREREPGRWEVYEDSGPGWSAVPGATYEIGQYEVGLRVPLQDSWGMDRATTQTYFRAVARTEPGWIVGEDRALGYVYPDDLSWRAVR
jgi:hypothetical protein